jgi:3-mercaptopyruvate sulfurtransferase SseA
VAQELMANGFTKVRALTGGWNDWVESKYPVENKQ